MDNNIATHNAKLLASCSVTFCILNGITPTHELSQAFASAVVANIGKWYKEHGMPNFNPQSDPICDEAIVSAFERMQQIADLASLSVTMGVGRE